MCFQINRKSSHSAQCVKNRIINKAIDYIIYFDTFEQQGVVIKVMLQSPRLEYHINTIGIDQLLSNGPSFGHKFLNNIKKIYKHFGECDFWEKLKTDKMEIHTHVRSFKVARTCDSHPSGRWLHRHLPVTYSNYLYRT